MRRRVVGGCVGENCRIDSPNCVEMGEDLPGILLS